MKCRLLWLLVCVASTTTAQVTITSNNFPFVPKVAYQPVTIGTVPAIDVSINAFWDLSGVKKQGARREILFEQVSNHPVFKKATERGEESVSLGPVALRQNTYYQKSASGVFLLGTGYQVQAVSLAFLTGNTDDSISLPAQTSILTRPAAKILFPLTINTNWASNYTSHTDFNLTLTDFGFPGTPCSFENHYFTTQNAISYGTARVPAKGKPGTTYPVVLVKTETVRIDSFFIDNAPANPFLLLALGQNQGDTQRTYQYGLYRENAGMQQLAIINFEDASYTTIKSAEYSAEFDILSVEGLTVTRNVLVYPNPVNNRQVSVYFNETPAKGIFTVTDITGKQIPVAVNAISENNYTLFLSDDTKPGIYQLHYTTNTTTHTTKLLVE